MFSLKWGSGKKYKILVLINEEYKTRDCGLSNEGLWSPNI
jgi:hypothetical protein